LSNLFNLTDQDLKIAAVFIISGMAEVGKEQMELMAVMGARRGKPVGPNPELFFVEHPVVHWKRRKDILEAHPTLNQLMGYDETSQIYAVALVALQLLLIASVAYFDMGIWAILTLSFFVGAYIDHALWVLIHDFGHGLGASSSKANTGWLIVSNAVHVWPSAVTFRYFHQKHHGQMNVVGGDPDLADSVEQQVFGHSSLGKIAWLALFPLLQAIRVGITQEMQKPDIALVLNWMSNLSVDVLILYALGPYAFLYMVASSAMSVGLHPVGARWIAEHYSVDAPQETYSTYGSINTVALNIGYHNEHHDFPNIPWQRLPQIRSEAPEFYDFLTYHTSYLRLLVAFLFNPSFTLNTRVVRASKKAK
jgi:sphingolipid 4-desaturase/C4-monooxygenase